QFLSEFLCGLAPLRSVLDRANSLFRPVQRQNKRRHVILHWFTKVFPCVAAAARAYDNVASCPASCKVNRQVRSMAPFTVTIARRYPSRRQGSQPTVRALAGGIASDQFERAILGVDRIRRERVRFLAGDDHEAAGGIDGEPAGLLLGRRASEVTQLSARA